MKFFCFIFILVLHMSDIGHAYPTDVEGIGRAIAESVSDPNHWTLRKGEPYIMIAVPDDRIENIATYGIRSFLESGDAGGNASFEKRLRAFNGAYGTVGLSGLGL